MIYGFSESANRQLAITNYQLPERSGNLERNGEKREFDTDDFGPIREITGLQTSLQQ
jgi:hypothetical protein